MPTPREELDQLRALKSQRIGTTLTPRQELEQLRSTNQAPAPQVRPQAPTQQQELQRLLKEQAQDVSGPQAFAIGAGRGLATIGRAIGLVDPEDDVARQAIEALKEERPIATGGGEIIGEALPFLPAGVAVGAIRSLAPRILASAGLGATETVAITRGLDEDVDTQIEAGLLGGVVAGTIEAVLPVIGRLGGSLIRRIKGKAPAGAILDEAGRPTKELQEALDASGMSFDDLTDEAQQILAKSPERVVPEQAVRKAIFEAEGLDPTKAQVTRNAADFQAQQEAAKTSGRVRDALESQDAILTTRFNQAVLETGGQFDTPTSTVTDALVDKASILDQQISDLYKVAREVAPGEKNVNFVRLREKLKQLKGSDRATGGAIDSIIGDLKAKQIFNKKGKLVGRVDVKTAEDVRKLMNELFDPQNGFRNGILRQLKDSLDDDVFSAAGVDTFKQGRAAKAAFEKELTRAKISKFDSRRSNLVRDVLENKISPDTFTNDVVFSKKWRGADLKQLKDYISTSNAGKSAFDDMRADVLNTIKNNAFIGPEDALGNKALSRASLESQFKKIGPQKMNVLFTSEERAFLDRMLRITKLREPVKGTALGRGPSAQAIGRLEKKLADLPVIGNLVEFIDVDVQGRGALKAKPSILPRQAGRIEKELRGVIAPVGAALTIQEQQ